MKLSAVVGFILGVALCQAEVYFKEEFADGDAWKKRWVKSEWKKSDGADGDFELGLPNDPSDEKRDMGITTKTDARFYTYSALFAKKFDNTGKNAVFQFQVTKNSSNWGCGGAYLKFGSAVKDRKKVTGDTDYNVMFGPDRCGAISKTHVIVNYGGKNLGSPKPIDMKHPEVATLFTLILYPNNTYVVESNEKETHRGDLKEHLPDKEVPDYTVQKPEEWDDREKIDDPEDKMPEDWVTVAVVPDPDAVKPDDWADDEDGEWTAPTKPNPAYKGEWKAKKITNPKYMGIWKHPMKANPEFPKDEKKPQDKMYAFSNFEMLTFDLWQVDTGFHFDNIIVTDDIKEAREMAAQSWKKLSAFQEPKLVERQQRAVKEEEERRAAELELEKAKAATADEVMDDDDKDDLSSYEDHIKDEL